MSQDQNAQDPLEFVRGMWSNMGFSLPGMVTPTLDVEELDKRIKDMKAVEGWLKMNLNMLQMSIQGLEMQRATIAAVKAMSQHAAGGEGDAGSGRQPLRRRRHHVAMESHECRTGSGWRRHQDRRRKQGTQYTAQTRRRQIRHRPQNTYGLYL